MPTSRWTEDEDADLSFLLNSRSIIRIERGVVRTKGKRASDQQLDIKRRQRAIQLDRPLPVIVNCWTRNGHYDDPVGPTPARPSLSGSR